MPTIDATNFRMLSQRLIKAFAGDIRAGHAQQASALRIPAGAVVPILKEYEAALGKAEEKAQELQTKLDRAYEELGAMCSGPSTHEPWE